MEWFISGESKKNLQNPFTQSIQWSGWRSMESMIGCKRKSKKKIPVLYWWFRNNCLFPSSSRTFRTQSYRSFIARQCCDSDQILTIYLPCWMRFQFAFHHQFGINTWVEVRIHARDRQYSFCLLILWIRVTRILLRLTWMYHVVHNTCIMHGKDIKTRKIGSTSILRSRKDWHSIRLHRMQSSFKGHFQLIVFKKVVRLTTGEVLYEKVYMSPRPPAKVSLKHEWKR